MFHSFKLRPLHISIKAGSAKQRSGQQALTEKPMIDTVTGAATHVCPPLFAPAYTTYYIHREQGPRLTTAAKKTTKSLDANWCT